MSKKFDLSSIDSHAVDECRRLAISIKNTENLIDEKSKRMFLDIIRLVYEIEALIMKVRVAGINQKKYPSYCIREELSGVSDRTYRNYLRIYKNWDWLISENKQQPTSIRHAIMLLNGMEQQEAKKKGQEVSNNIKQALLSQIQGLKRTVYEQEQIIAELQNTQPTKKEDFDYSFIFY